MKTYTQIENNIEYFVIEYSLEENNNDTILKLQQKYKYNKCIINDIGTFYNKYELFHNEFGPSIIFNLYGDLDEDNGLGFHLNGKSMSKKQFIRYTKLKKLSNTNI